MSYIDREDTVKALNRLCDRVCQYSRAQRFMMCGVCLLGDAFIVIENEMPDADVEPIRHGERIYKEYKPTQGDVIGFYSFECSECGCASWIKEYNYCPYCGAKMDKGET